MALCPICSEILEETGGEFIDEFEENFRARCGSCGWRGSVSYIEDEGEIIWDDRTDKQVPTDDAEIEAWRAEQSQYYNV